ncbi:uncharacterized protein CLAFUR5_10722 [Fulvia fulva]|uniref:Uncharacterized protein n=1 Tax=Passalora fulva TaxID=5499 RepID=A0A9Q8URX7_PASFU|nr:uncharacterized protein CLAFUR5_10722 [Fulvia fulva]KAK4621094.1 hypothetical protein CLAFUR0_11692 [Fulvia fulva]UJO20187.1 hypothetical protein CLAFUR5_10722 [Fulvia fulva]WPV31973.1 hypothetical protein CLAFUW7_11682 [Fulvia fulva]
MRPEEPRNGSSMRTIAAVPFVTPLTRIHVAHISNTSFEQKKRKQNLDAMWQSSYAAHALPRQSSATRASSIPSKCASMLRKAAQSIPGMIVYRQHELEWTEAEWADLLADQRLTSIVCMAVETSSTAINDGNIHNSNKPKQDTLEDG